MNSGVVLDLNQLRRHCSACALHELCLPAGIDRQAMDRLDDVVRDRSTLEKGKPLFRQGDVFHALYVVRSGSLKTYVESPTGESQILGFSLPGELVGVDALANDRHLCSAEALERTSVCELPFGQLDRVAREVPALNRQLLRVISREVAAEQHHLVTMGKQQAQERLATFLRSLSERYGRLSRDPNTLTLPMSRYDIANYLGLVVETVSRLFGRMENAGVLEVSRKTIRILRPDLLTALCNGSSEAVPESSQVRTPRS